MRRLGWLAAGGLVTLLSGCPGPGPGGDPPPDIREPFPDGRPIESSLFMDPRVDHRDPTSLVDAPPPISGGTLHILRSARIAVVADPDRDRIVTVDLTARAILGETTSLPPGAEPGRITEDAAGRVHVVLRGTGEIYSFSPEAVDEGLRRAACAMPRGIAYDEANDQLHVACRGGELVTFDPERAAPVRTVQLESDLRDVIVQGDRLLVTRFRSAELIELDAAGTPVSTRTPVASLQFGRGVAFDDFGNPVSDGSGEFEPAVAWRAISAPATGDVAMVHQRASGQEVQPAPGGYGGGSFCESSIVHSSVTFFLADGTVTRGPDLSRVTLPVDVALSPVLDGGPQWVAVVAAGNESGESVFVYQRTSLEWREAGDCMGSEVAVTEPIPNATSVAWTADGQLVVLSRDAVDGSGAQLVVLGSDANVRARISLGGGSTFDTGHAIFHANSGGFIACASCHPEGAEDGRVWTFGRIGPRRTPAMHGDLRGTEPFHWDGDMSDLGHLAEEVFTGRMQGPRLHPTQVDALGQWIDELPAPVVSHAAVDRESAERGRALFYGSAQCGTCHSGALLTNNVTVDVGTGGAFQVPSLTGVSFRTPVMHSGCATTLRDRFEPACGGGDLHGRTSHLGESDIDDLVAFMRTL